MKLNEKTNWAALRNQAAIAAMQGTITILSSSDRFAFRDIVVEGYRGEKKTYPNEIADFAVACADALIAELRNQPLAVVASNDSADLDLKNMETPIDFEKDVAIGEVVEFDGERLVCIEDGSIDGFLEECSGCAFMKNGKCRSIVRSCSKDKRYDGKDVIFKKIS